MTNETHVTLVGSCPICERSIAVGDRERLVHHGYKRPGNGQIQGDCFAVGYEPYERSTSACVAYQKLRQRGLVNARADLAKLEAGEVTYLREVSFGRGHKIIVVEYIAGVTAPEAFRTKIERKKLETRHAIAEGEAEVLRMQRFIDSWMPAELGTETRYDREAKAASEARQAERAAARAVKAEKAQILAEKKLVREVKTAELQTSLRVELEALAERAEATDTLRSVHVQAAARAILEQYSKRARKTPKISFSCSDLGAEWVFVQLGLAERRADDGWVRYEVWEVG